MKYAKEIYGPLGKYLGHFRSKKVLAAGHNVTKPLAETLEKSAAVSEEDKRAAKQNAAQQEEVLKALGIEEPRRK
jgi:hypothetical protein